MVYLQIYQRIRKDDLWKNYEKKVTIFYNAEQSIGMEV